MKLNEEQKELLKKIGIKWDDQTRPNLTNEQLNKVIQEDKTLGEFIKENQETLKMVETVKFIEKNAGLFMEYFDDLASIKYGKVDPRPITVRFALANYILERDSYAFGALNELLLQHQNEVFPEANAYGIINKLVEEEAKDKGLYGASKEDIESNPSLQAHKKEFDKHVELYRKHLTLCKDRRDLNNDVTIKTR